MSSELKPKLTSMVMSFTARFFLIGFLILILLIPLVMIGGIIKEREDYYDGAKEEVISKWGGRQTLIGPVLSIPFSQAGQSGKEVYYDELHLLPSELSVTGDVTPEVRSRGIFDILLYQAKLQVRGSFLYPSSELLNGKKMNWNKARLSLGISEVSGLEKEVQVAWPGSSLFLQPNPSSSALETSPFLLTEGDRYDFSFELEFKGAESLLLANASKTMMASLASSWPHPRFTGSMLPSLRDLDETGFKANWNSPVTAKGVLPFYVGDAQSYFELLQDSAFGVDLFYPVDFYQQATRSVKYGILFVVLTFVAFFLFEVITRLRIHPFQYLLVGAALCLFYLLLLSLAEHIAFTNAYFVSSLATILLISSYCTKVLHDKKRGGIMGLILVALYGYLYFTLQSVDYALLTGSILLFIALAFLMYLTRNIDWYRTSEG